MDHGLIRDQLRANAKHPRVATFSHLRFFLIPPSSHYLAVVGSVHYMYIYVLIYPILLLSKRREKKVPPRPPYRISKVLWASQEEEIVWDAKEKKRIGLFVSFLFSLFLHHRCSFRLILRLGSADGEAMGKGCFVRVTGLEKG